MAESQHPPARALGRRSAGCGIYERVELGDRVKARVWQGDYGAARHDDLAQPWLAVDVTRLEAHGRLDLGLFDINHSRHTHWDVKYASCHSRDAGTFNNYRIDRRHVRHKQLLLRARPVVCGYRSRHGAAIHHSSTVTRRQRTMGLNFA